MEETNRNMVTEQKQQSVQDKREGSQSEKIKEKDIDNYVAQFCGSVAPGQGFFYIEDTPGDQKVKDVTTLALIEVVKGEATARQIEGEFRTLAGEGSTWRWYTKRIGEKKFQMSFPNVQTLATTSHFREMKLRSMEAVAINVFKWTEGIGAKGKLDEAWFRIIGIPM